MDRIAQLDNGYKVFTLRVARELQNRGFKLLGTEPNINHPDYKVFVFENTLNIIKAVTEIKNIIKNR